MLIQCSHLYKSYFIGNIEVKALIDINLKIKKGSYTAILGPSGSGKSTLMNILGCLDTPTEGDYYLDNINVNSLPKRELVNIRNQKIGFIFQNFNLLSRYNVFHNVELPLIYSGLSKKERNRAVEAAINKVGLSHRRKHRPNELSGGEKQRVAIARALVTNPTLILADEPTGNLDSKTGKDILNIFKKLIKAKHTIIMVTHDLNIAKTAQQRVILSDGKIIRKTRMQ